MRRGDRSERRIHQSPGYLSPPSLHSQQRPWSARRLPRVWQGSMAGDSSHQGHENPTHAIVAGSWRLTPYRMDSSQSQQRAVSCAANHADERHPGSLEQVVSSTTLLRAPSAIRMPTSQVRSATWAVTTRSSPTVATGRSRQTRRTEPRLRVSSRAARTNSRRAAATTERSRPATSPGRRCESPEREPADIDHLLAVVDRRIAAGNTVGRHRAQPRRHRRRRPA